MGEGWREVEGTRMESDLSDTMQIVLEKKRVCVMKKREEEGKKERKSEEESRGKKLGKSATEWRGCKVLLRQKIVPLAFLRFEHRRFCFSFLLFHFHTRTTDRSNKAKKKYA